MSWGRTIGWNCQPSCGLDGNRLVGALWPLGSFPWRINAPPRRLGGRQPAAGGGLGELRQRRRSHGCSFKQAKPQWAGRRSAVHTRKFAGGTGPFSMALLNASRRQAASPRYSGGDLLASIGDLPGKQGPGVLVLERLESRGGGGGGGRSAPAARPLICRSGAIPVRLQVLRERSPSSMKPPSVEFEAVHPHPDCIEHEAAIRATERRGHFSSRSVWTMRTSPVRPSCWCLPAPAVAATSSFDSTSVTVRAGEPVRLRLTARDAFGNECREGGGLVSMYDAEPSSEPDRQAPTPSAAALAAASATPPPSPFYHERLLGPGDAVSVVDGAMDDSASLVLHRVGRRLIVGRIDRRAIDGRRRGHRHARRAPRPLLHRTRRRARMLRRAGRLPAASE